MERVIGIVCVAAVLVLATALPLAGAQKRAPDDVFRRWLADDTSQARVRWRCLSEDLLLDSPYREPYIGAEVCLGGRIRREDVDARAIEVELDGTPISAVVVLNANDHCVLHWVANSKLVQVFGTVEAIDPVTYTVTIKSIRTELTSAE
jgi:hypothetical protein